VADKHGNHERDAALAEELKAHHAEMIRDLDRLTTALAHAAASVSDAARAKHDLERWVTDVLIRHAEEEEETTYRAAGELPEGRLLIKSMLAEHELIRLIARHILQADNPIAAGAFGRALFELFDSHQRKENDIILPLLVDAELVSLTGVMSDTRDHRHGHDHEHNLDHDP
jgi:hypothetical protein